MVAATRDSAPQTQPNPASASAEEEALKRSTDCVYFLASPLTCKKGAECEYRHSEYARVNPRDCWYWLNGNCLNPKCAFRHPPLDGLLGNQAAASAGSSFPPVHNPMPVASQASVGVAGSSKQAVPCIFFQKGHCLKGDRCAFQHLANPAGNKNQQTSVAAPVSEPQNPAKKAFGGFEKCSQEPKKPELPKPMALTVTAKATPKVNNVLPRNGVGVEKIAQPFQAMEDIAYRSQASNAAPVHSGNMQNRPSSRMHQSHVVEDHSFHNDKEADEFQRESSPGFDVLVDDELGDSEYYHGEDRYNRNAMGHEENLNSIEYEMDHHVDYNDLDREPLYNSRKYDSYDHLHGDYRGDSSERMLVGSGYVERRSNKRNGGSPDYAEDSDLRHRLIKQRRVNGLRSVVNQDFASDDHSDGRNSFRNSQRNSQHVSSQEGSRGSRLKGRITLPRRSPVGGNEFHSDREMDRGIARRRSSPQRSHGASYQGRLQGRLKGRVQEDANNEGKNLRGWVRKPVMDERSTDFAGPKSLAELKGMKQETDGQESSFIGKQRSFKPLNNQPADDLSFEGPKPLSEILKRKRGAGTMASLSDPSINKEENSRREERETLPQNANKEEAKFTTVDADGTGDKGRQDESSHLNNSGEEEYEDGVIPNDAMEENELEEEDQRNGEYYYDEQGDEGEYYEEGENAEADGEDYLDEEDGDDFAKKVGVMLS